MDMAVKPAPTPTRKVEVGGIMYDVPKYVVRDGNWEVRRWIVVLPGRPRKHFSDSKYSNRPRLSLEAASAYADSLRHLPIPASRIGKCSKGGMNVMFRFERGVMVFYVRAYQPQNNAGPRLFYIGNEFTANDERCDQALTLAQNWRNEKVAEHLRKTRRVLR